MNAEKLKTFTQFLLILVLFIAQSADSFQVQRRAVNYCLRKEGAFSQTNKIPDLKHQSIFVNGFSAYCREAAFTTSTSLAANPPNSKRHSTGQMQPESDTNLNKFRSLMGSLYGIAGLAHAADCFAGESQLIVSAGSPPFPELSLEGQALTSIWCLSGPVAFALSRSGSTTADVGLILYGIIEVTAASFLPDGGALINAVLVQGIVLASWIYSRQKVEDVK